MYKSEKGRPKEELVFEEIGDGSEIVDTKPDMSRDEAVRKAFLLNAGKLDISKESEKDLKKIKEIRMAILKGEKY